MIIGLFKPKAKDDTSPQPGDVGVMNDSQTAAMVRFPTAWTSRVQTPVKRVPPGKMWSQPVRYWPQSYGGVQR